MSRRDRGQLRPHTTRQRPYMPPEPDKGEQIDVHASTEKDFVPGPENKVAEAFVKPSPPPKPAPPKLSLYPSVARIHQPGQTVDPPETPTLRELLSIAQGRIDKLESDRDVLVEELVNLSLRVLHVEEQNHEFLTALRDAMADRAAPTTQAEAIENELSLVLEFMREHAGMKFTGLTIAENLTNLSMTNSVVGGRLQTLFRRGLIRSEKRPNRTTMYWAEATS